MLDDREDVDDVIFCERLPCFAVHAVLPQEQLDAKLLA